MGAAPLALATWGWPLIALAALAALWALFVAVLYVSGRGPAARALARFVPDLVVLFRRLLADPRVPRRAKVALALCLGYLALPVDIVPDIVPVAGALDDAIIVALVLRYALGAAGPALVEELWPGPPQSLGPVLALAGGGWSARLSWLWTLTLGVAVPLLVFVLLAEDVWESETIDWDTPLLRWVDGHQDDTLTAVARVVTGFGGASLVATLLLATLVVPLAARRRRPAAFLLLATAGAGFLNLALKDLFDRPRPDVFTHLVAVQSTSFPSGHTMVSAAFAAALIAVAWSTPCRRLVTAAALGYALAIGASRVYLGVHFPSDVVAGWAVTVAWVSLAWLAVMRPEPAGDVAPAPGAAGRRPAGEAPAP